ncbi:MAG: hypothetical protein RRY64_00315 [Oscillospiraceae bacterium]
MFLTIIMMSAGLGGTIGSAIATLVGGSVVTGTAIGTLSGAGIGLVGIAAESVHAQDD